MRHSFNFVIRL